MNKRRSGFFEITVIMLILVIGAVMIYLTVTSNDKSRNSFNPEDNPSPMNLQNQKMGEIESIDGDIITVNIYSRPNDNGNNSSDGTLKITIDDNIKIYTSEGHDQSETQTNRDALTIGSMIRIQYDEDNTAIQKIIIMPNSN